MHYYKAKDVILNDEMFIKGYICRRIFMDLKIKRTRGIYWLAVLSILFAIGCTELSAPEPERLGYDYFPLIIGEFRIYDVEVINYLDGSTDTTNYQLREVVSDSSIIGDETSYRLDRYRRANASESWVIDSVWSARLNPYQAIVVEHNVPIIKLSFPLVEDKRWDGNALNSIEFDEFKMENIGGTYQIDGIDYPNSLEMFKEDLLDPLKITRDDYQLEVFSAGIGLIFRQEIFKQYCSDCPEQGKIEEGIVYEQKLLEIGKIE
jgi:hypothetical protein